jgi:integrase
MITEKQIQKAIREAAAGGKAGKELRDDGERGTGRLVLWIKPRGARVTAEWYAVFYRGGKRAKAKLGSYPAMSVAEARRVFLTDYAPVISGGSDPKAAKRRQTSAGTVAELFEAYVDHLRLGGKRSAKLVHGLLLSPKTGGAARAIGADRPAADITPGDIVPLLAKIHARGARVQANMVRAYLSSAFNFGLKAEHDFTKADIGARWALKINPVTAIPSDESARRVGNRFLSPAEFRTVWLWLSEFRERSRIASATMLKMATGQRTEEVLHISDTGYDRHKAMLNWEKTKNSLAHSIPIPHQAAAILDLLPCNSHGWYFPGMRDPAITAGYAAVTGVIQKFLLENPGFAPFTPRDIRRTWKTLAGDAGIPKDMRDRLQNHAKRGDVSSRHYDRYDYLPERRAAMAKWAAYLDLVISGTVDQLGAREGNVVAFGGAAVLTEVSGGLS